MHVPHFNAMVESHVHEFVTAIGSAELVTVGPDGTPLATLLPILWSEDRLTVVAHMARANPHWRAIRPGSRALAIVGGPQAYVSPGWYASKAEHGRVVPTWNYSSVHLIGSVTLHDELSWARDAVTRLTDHHEQGRDEPWAVTDAPETYIRKNLQAIVGIQMQVERVDAKTKLSQNRSAEDRAGVVRGLRAEGGNPRVADAMDV